MAREIDLFRPGRLFSREVSGEWEPFRQLRRMERDLDRLMARMFEETPSQRQTFLPTGDVRFLPACDLQETSDHYLISFDLPGVSKDEIHIDVIGNELRVNGERKKEKKEKEEGYYLTEREYGRFERTFNLPSDVKAENIEASFQDGVLRVAIPKSEEVRAKTRTVKIGEGKPSLWNKLVGKGEKEKEKGEAAPSKKVA